MKPESKRSDSGPLKGLTALLWIAAIGCFLAVPFLFLPWSVLEGIISWFGIEAFPDSAMVRYFVRVFCGIIGLIGLFFVILAKNPLGYGAMLPLGAYGLIIFGLTGLFLGFLNNLPSIVFLGDGISGIVLGGLIVYFSNRAKQASKI